MTQRVSVEQLAELKAALAKRTIAALDEREGRQARDYQLAREVDAGLTVGQAEAIIGNLEEARSTSDVFCDQCEAEIRIADLTRERDYLALQLDSCQGALKETIVENSANCDRAEKAERERDEAQIRIQTIQQQYDELGKHATELEQSSRRHVQEREEAVQRAEWFHEHFHNFKELESKTHQRLKTAETALAEARQRIAHLEGQLADAETARTLALGIAERAERERDEAKGEAV